MGYWGSASDPGQKDIFGEEIDFSYNIEKPEKLEAVKDKMYKKKKPKTTWSLPLQEDKKDILDEESEPEG